MKINIKKTMEYYNIYIPCNCGDCRYFVKHINAEQTDICNYLRAFGINPLKPYELMSFHHKKDNKIEYFNCAYIAIGNMEEEMEKEINGVKIKTCSKEKFPLENIVDDYFLITFGPITMKYAYINYRHFTFDEKVQIIKHGIDVVDPMELLLMHCPNDEYLQESIMIAKKIKNQKANFVKGKYIQEVFQKQFDKALSTKQCNEIAKRINISFDMKEYFKCFEENELLRGKVSINDFEITLKIHNDFIIKNVGNKTYINDKFYYDIEEQDLLVSLIEFVEDKDSIFVQYKHKHFFFSFIRLFGYFKKMKHSKYSFRKLRHKKDIELIFNNKEVIYFKN